MRHIKIITTIVLLLVGANMAFANTYVAPNPEKDPNKAFNYVYTIVVKKNNTDKWAAYLLGKYYETGYGTSKNITQAYIWYSMSAVYDYQPAVSALARLKKSMSTSEIKSAQKKYVIARDESVKKSMAMIQYSIRH